jgi:hypothetical protein
VGVSSVLTAWAIPALRSSISIAPMSGFVF